MGNVMLRSVRRTAAKGGNSAAICAAAADLALRGRALEAIAGYRQAIAMTPGSEQAPVFEKMLVDSGIHLNKFWFSVTRHEQRTRFAIRQIDPVRRWKLSPVDLASLDRWEDYTEAKEETFLLTDTDHAPWITIKSNDKKRGRINAIRFFLNRFDYDDKDTSVVYEPDPLIVRRGREAVGD